MFAVSGSDYSAICVLTLASTRTPGTDAVTGISGVLNNVAITGVATGTPSTVGPFEYVTYFTVGNGNYGPQFDNLYYTTGVPLDSYGFAFTLANGDVDNIYIDSGQTTLLTPENFTAANLN